jgi:hypothetical protein
MAEKALFEKGDRIVLIEMLDDSDPIPPGSLGTVEWCERVESVFESPFWQVSVKWDSGRGLMLVMPPDKARKARRNV